MLSTYEPNTPFVPTVTSEIPNLPQLLEVSLHSRVAPKVYDFGTFLLQDDLGNRMEIIRGNHQGRLEEMTREVPREWLAGKGVGGVVGELHSNSEEE